MRLSARYMLLFLPLLSAVAYSQSPICIWANSIGGKGIDHAQSIAIDASGNVYTTGYFDLTVDFDPGEATFNLTTNGRRNMFISKLDALGNLVWARPIGEIGGNIICNSISVDASGNVYTSGQFHGNVDFDPEKGKFNLSSAVDSWDIFILKLNTSGHFVWAKRMGGTGNDGANSLALDASGNIYSTGFFQQAADFDPGKATLYLISVGYQDIFISKLDSLGNFVWAKAMEGKGSIIGKTMAVDPSGNVYISGNFKETIDFDPGPRKFILTSKSSVGDSHDIFISKLDSSGNLVWVKSKGGEDINSITLDASRNLYTTGVNRSYLTISKLDAFGNFQWEKQMGGTSLNIGETIIPDEKGNLVRTEPKSGEVITLIRDSKASAVGNSITTDASGNIYTIGSFSETVDFDPGRGIFTLTSTGKFGEIFISKLNKLGDFVWAKALGSGANQGGDVGKSIVTDASGNLYFTGDFNDAAIPFGVTTLTNAGTADIFIAKFK